MLHKFKNNLKFDNTKFESYVFIFLFRKLFTIDFSFEVLNGKGLKINIHKTEHDFVGKL